MEYEHLTENEKALIVALSLLVSIPSLAVLAFSPVHGQEVERHVTPIDVPPGTNLEMGLMYHKPLTLQQKEFSEVRAAASKALSASGAAHADKLPILGTLVNADRAAKAGDYDGAMALIAAAERAIKKLP